MGSSSVAHVPRSSEWVSGFISRILNLIGTAWPICESSQGLFGKFHAKTGCCRWTQISIANPELFPQQSRDKRIIQGRALQDETIWDGKADVVICGHTNRGAPGMQCHRYLAF